MLAALRLLLQWHCFTKAKKDISPYYSPVIRRRIQALARLQVVPVLLRQEQHGFDKPLCIRHISLIATRFLLCQCCATAISLFDSTPQAESFNCQQHDDFELEKASVGPCALLLPLHVHSGTQGAHSSGGRLCDLKFHGELYKGKTHCNTESLFTKCFVCPRVKHKSPR